MANAIVGRAMTTVLRGEPYVKLCVDVCAYWQGTLDEHRDAVLAFCEGALSQTDGALRWYETETMGRPAPINVESLGLLGFWLRDPRARRQIMTLELQGGEDPSLPSDVALVFKYLELTDGPVGVCRLVLPVQVGATDPDQLLDLTHRLCAQPGFTHGTAGFAVNWNPRSPVARRAKEQFPYIAARFPGIDIPNLTGTLLTVSKGIKSINWLTMLSGGLWALVADEFGEATAEHGVVVHRLDGGVIVQAGSRPILGDTYHDECLDSYRVVGRALRVLRCREHPVIIPAEDEDESVARTEAWLSRWEGDKACN